MGYAWPKWLVEGTPRPERRRKTFTTCRIHKADSPLKPSGLPGPVRNLPLVEVDLVAAESQQSLSSADRMHLMRRNLIRALGVLLMVPAAGAAILHRFVCVDNGGKTAKLIHVDQTRPDAGWVVALPGEGPRDLQWIGRGRVLASLSSGFGEYDLATGRELRRVSGFKDIVTARRLENGHTLLACTEPNVILVHEVDAEGRPRAEPRRIACTGRPLRQMRVLPNGNLLLHVAADTVGEVDPAGRTVWTLRLPADIPGTKGTLAERLPDGSTLVGLGNGHRVSQFDPQGRTLRSWGEPQQGDHPEWKLDYISGFEHLPAGHVLMCNWQGHLPVVTGPHLVQFDAANRLVWQWGDATQARQVTNVLVLDKYEPPSDVDRERVGVVTPQGVRDGAPSPPRRLRTDTPAELPRGMESR